MRPARRRCADQTEPPISDRKSRRADREGLDLPGGGLVVVEPDGALVPVELEHGALAERRARAQRVLGVDDGLGRPVCALHLELVLEPREPVRTWKLQVPRSRPAALAELERRRALEGFGPQAHRLDVGGRCAVGEHDLLRGPLHPLVATVYGANPSSSLIASMPRVLESFSVMTREMPASAQRRTTSSFASRARPAAPVGPCGPGQVVVGEPVRTVCVDPGERRGLIVDEDDDAELAVEVGAFDRLRKPLVEREVPLGVVRGHVSRRFRVEGVHLRQAVEEVGQRNDPHAVGHVSRRDVSTRRGSSADRRSLRPGANPRRSRNGALSASVQQRSSRAPCEIRCSAARSNSAEPSPRRRWSGWTIAQRPATSSTSVAQSNSASPQPTIRPASSATQYLRCARGGTARRRCRVPSAVENHGLCSAIRSEAPSASASSKSLITARA